MRPETIQRLLEINRTFYSNFAEEFSQTRSERQASVSFIISMIPAGAKVLDVGCGHGRIALALERARRRVTYRGVDGSRAMIAIAQASSASFQNVRADFAVADLANSAWARAFADVKFDVVLALAVLHHLPSFQLRARVLADLARLCRGGGVIVLTSWQFLENERMRKKIVAWSAAPVDADDVEEGDTLLSWKRGGVGYRYCHQITIDEITKIAESCGLRVERQFCADDGLNLYSILTRASG
jgi:2-polyprenyl-3-methyl-5-hydroxy-6-metoxy-1,4-benzoquinol methylase